MASQVPPVDLNQIAVRNNMTVEEVEQFIAAIRESMEPFTKRVLVREDGVDCWYAVERRGVGVLNTPNGKFWQFDFLIDDHWGKYSVIVRARLNTAFMPVFQNDTQLVLRTDSGCETGQVFGDLSCECYDQLHLALKKLDEDEKVAEVTDRTYWVEKGSEKTVKMADTILEWANEIEPGYELKYNKFYISLAKDERPRNFITVRPQRSRLRIDFKAPFSEDNQKLIKESDLEDMGYSRHWGVYRISVTPQEIGDASKQEVIKNLLRLAHDAFRQ